MTVLLPYLFQLVWATSSRIGCAINVCYNMNVWGQIWTKAVYLVCNYSPKWVTYSLFFIYYEILYSFSHLYFDSLSMLSLLLCVLLCVEVTGGDMPHINMAPLALPAHLAMEEFAEKTSVIKVWSLYYCSFQLCPYIHCCSKV